MHHAPCGKAVAGAAKGPSSGYARAAMPTALAIFDLDGTLADSLPWFRQHMNDVADRFGFRRIAEADIAPLRRMGPREILEHLGVPRWKVPMIARHMRRLKAAHIGDIPLFPGVDAMLRAVRGRRRAPGAGQLRPRGQRAPAARARPTRRCSRISPAAQPCSARR